MVWLIRERSVKCGEGYSKVYRWTTAEGPPLLMQPASIAPERMRMRTKEIAGRKRSFDNPGRDPDKRFLVMVSPRVVEASVPCAGCWDIHSGDITVAEPRVAR